MDLKKEFNAAVEEPFRVWHFVVAMAALGIALLLLGGCVPVEDRGSSQPDVQPWVRARQTSLEEDVNAMRESLEANRRMREWNKVRVDDDTI